MEGASINIGESGGEVGRAGGQGRWAGTTEGGWRGSQGG